MAKIWQQLQKCNGTNLSIGALFSTSRAELYMDVVNSPISHHLINGLIVEGHKLLRQTALHTLYHTINSITSFKGLALNIFFTVSGVF